MNEDIFSGPFAAMIQDHIAIKRAIGYKYEAEYRHLLRFSKFTAAKHPEAKTLTKEIVLAWCGKKNYETQANHCSRASIIRQFAIYMNHIGKEAFILPKGYFRSEKQYTPHIFTDEELHKFFHQTDRNHYIGTCPCRHLIMPLFFRMIYSCGLRQSEARLLRRKDVDLAAGILSIKHAKNDNDRLVPMSDNLTKLCLAYYNKVHLSQKDRTYFFPGLNDRPMTITNVYHNFRRFLWRAGISHGGRGKGPRIHDFRHSFACHCLKKWVIQGKDLNAYLPVLKTYLGHSSFEDTAYYLRLTADIYPNIIVKIEGYCAGIIPVLEGDRDEHN
jgi:integrase/recombinase XerD